MAGAEVSKYTPGPWRLSTTPGNSPRIYVDQSRESQSELATVYSEANARLIAAAPDLLVLAQQYASECGECAGVGITPDDEDCTECKFIRDVIAKATQP